MKLRLLFSRTNTGRSLLLITVLARRLCWVCELHAHGAIKRAFDIFASAILILGLLPFFALIALCVKLEDGGPVLFTQIRVGKNGKLFKMYKFRSMVLDAEQRMRELLARNQHQHGITFKIKDDPRVTHVGKWIRKISFDELPQLFNVLLGDMSLVGPRPPVPREVALYSVNDRQRLSITPGITCLWQIGGRSELDFPQQVQLDLLYIRKQSFWTDLVILFKTIPAVLHAKGAY